MSNVLASRRVVGFCLGARLAAVIRELRDIIGLRFFTEYKEVGFGKMQQFNAKFAFLLDRRNNSLSKQGWKKIRVTDYFLAMQGGLIP